MLILAQIDISVLITLGIAILGLSSLIFAALRYRRDDTTAVLNQQNTIMDEMKALNDELRNSAISLREERDALRAEVGNLTKQVEALTVELQEFKRAHGD